MRNFAVHIAKHNSTSSYRMHAVVHQLDLARYGYDIRLLCRSLRRDDLTFSSFGHLVGTLLCESLYTKGTHAVTYMQMRLQRRRTCAALQEAVGFLLEMTHTIKIDTFGQPDGKNLFAKGRKRLLVVGDSSEEQSDHASDGSEQSQHTENGHCHILHNRRRSRNNRDNQNRQNSVTAIRHQSALVCEALMSPESCICCKRTVIAMIQMTVMYMGISISDESVSCTGVPFLSSSRML
eukprot:1576157-Rhodomonas_salina.2